MITIKFGWKTMAWVVGNLYWHAEIFSLIFPLYQLFVVQIIYLEQHNSFIEPVLANSDSDSDFRWTFSRDSLNFQEEIAWQTAETLQTKTAWLKVERI